MDNNIDDIDKLFIDYFEQNKDVPNIISNGIECALNSTNQKQSITLLIKKIIITMIGMLTITGGIVFAKEISNFVQSLFCANSGIDKAINDGYIYEPENIYSESEDAELILNAIVMDDYNLNLSFSVNFKENIDVSNICKIDLSDICISDESNNVLCCTSKDLYKDFCYEKSIDYNESNYRNINTSKNIFIRDLNEKYMFFVLNLTGEFPKSKKLFVRYKDINLSNESRTIKTCIKGDWTLNIDIPEKFYNRKEVIYKLDKCNNSNIYTNSVETVTYSTGTNFQMLMKGNLINENEDKKIKREKLDKIFQESTTENLIIKPNAYIENEKGKRYYLVGSLGSGAYGITEDGNISYSAIFDMNIKSATNKLTVFLEMYNGEKLIFDLCRY